jgi:RimJ/RimL family protein N-acetyltransferase
MPIRPGQVVARLKLKDGSTAIVRAPRMSDLDGLLALINGLVKENAMILADKPYKRKDEAVWLRNLLKDLKAGKVVHLVAETDGGIVGSTTVNRQQGKSKHVGVFGIIIKGGYRNLGLGTAMSDATLGQARRAGLKLVLLEVFDSNPKARHMYEKLGFREVGRVPKKLYHKGEYHSGIMMAREISRME